MNEASDDGLAAWVADCEARMGLNVDELRACISDYCIVRDDDGSDRADNGATRTASILRTLASCDPEFRALLSKGAYSDGDTVAERVACAYALGTLSRVDQRIADAILAAGPRDASFSAYVTRTLAARGI